MHTGLLTSSLSGLPVVTERTAMFFSFLFLGAYGGTVFALLLPGRIILPCCSVCKVRESQIEHYRENAQKATYEKTQPFMCPNKLQKDFASREFERDVEHTLGWRGGWGRNNLLTGMLTDEFSL